MSPGQSMMMHPMRSKLLVLAVAVLLAGPVFAGKAEIGEPGGSTPMPSEGKELELSFNPTVKVVVQDGETIRDLFQRLADRVRDAAGNLYVVEAQLTEPPFGLEILRANGRELDRLSLRENDPALQINTITVDFPGLLARIGRTRETPSGGAVIIRLNQVEIQVPTDAADSPATLDDKILNEILAAGFEAELGPEFLVVLRDREGQSLRRVGIQSLDAAIVSSHIGLELSPVDSEGIPTMTPAGFALLMGMLLLAGLLVLRRRGTFTR